MILKLRQHIISRFGKEPPHLERVLNAFEEVECKKGEFILIEGEICKEIYFVVEGCLQVEAVDEKGEQKILGFVFEDNWYTVMDSFQNRAPSKETILTTERSKYVKLSKRQFDNLKIEVPEFVWVYGQVLEEHYGQFMLRINTLMTLDATERVEWFIKKYPGMMSRLNSNTIANYLNIRPETLSRIKSKIFNS